MAFVGAAFGFLHLPSIICVSFYFDSRRALAVGITSCGTPLGAMIFAPLTDILLQVSYFIVVQYELSPFSLHALGSGPKLQENWINVDNHAS